ncbi:MAG: PulJ/GspJ family protein [Planctomycetota bacterium]|jgi:hypothetical protein
MKNARKTSQDQGGFSLAEVLASVTIGAMILVTMLTIYRRAETSAATVARKIEQYQLPFEILQRIAEDLDRIITSGSGTKITIENKIVDGYPAARLTMVTTFKGDKGGERVFEKIVWQSSSDLYGDANGLVLYRSHSGMSVEDKLFDEKRADLEKLYPLVPVCRGVTTFSIRIPKGEDFLNSWAGVRPPHGIVATLSFAEPYETLEGTWEVFEEDRVSRAIAIDRSRKIRFVIVERKLDEEGLYDEEEDTEDEETDAEEQEDTGEEDEETGEEDREESPDAKEDDTKPGVKLPGEKSKR